MSKVKFIRPGRDKPRLTTDQKRAARRVRELSRVYYRQYPWGLPHNGVGVKYAKYMCRTMAFLPDDRREQWLDNHARWIDASTRDYFLRLGPYWYAARSLGEHLELDDELREDAQAWSIEAYDISKEDREVINREKNRKAQDRRRRKNGAKPREQSLSRTKPWEALGIKRRAWERRRKADDANTSRPSLLISNTNDELASSPSQPRGQTLAGKKLIPFPIKKARPKKADTVTMWASGRPMGIHRTPPAEPKPSLKLVWSVPTPEQVARMATLERGYACTSVESPAAELARAA